MGGNSLLMSIHNAGDIGAANMASMMDQDICDILKTHYFLIIEKIYVSN